MLDEGQPLSVMVAGQGEWNASDDGTRILQDGDPTLLPLYLDPMTKLFLVALMWCRPWLLDPAAATPLPRTPEIARAALEVTGAYHELERFDRDPAFRDFMRQVTTNLFPPQNRQEQDHNNCVPPGDC
jgi:hypothetical protein